MSGKRSARVARVGDPIDQGGLRPRLLSISRDALGRIEALLDFGDRVERTSWVELMRRGQPPDLPSAVDLVEETYSPLLAELSEDRRRGIEERYRHLMQVRTGSLRGNPDLDRQMGLLDPDFDPKKTKESERILAKEKQMRKLHRRGYSRAQIYRELQAIEAAGIEGLIHGSRRSGSDRLKGFDVAVVDAVRDILTQEKGLASRSKKAMSVVVRSELDQRGLGQDLSAYALQALIGELSRGMGMHLNAASRQRDSIKPIRVYGTRAVSRPGELVQIDATRTNLHVYDPDAGWMPANILTAIDVYSRCVLALRVVTGDVNAGEVGMLLWDIGKHHVTNAGWPYELEFFHGQPRQVAINSDPAQPCLGAEVARMDALALVPTTIVLDRGAENISRLLVSTATRCGFDVIYAPPGAGYAKGFIESLHNSHDYLQSLFESYKGADPTNHPRGSEERALLTARDLADVLWTWVNEVYHNRPHSGLAKDFAAVAPISPAAVFTAALRAGGQIDLIPDPYAYIGFLPQTTARVGDYGLRVDKHVYNSADVVLLRRYAQAGIGAKAKDLVVHRDPQDLSRIFVRHPGNGRWLCVPHAQRQGGQLVPFSELITRHVLQTCRAEGQAATVEQQQRAEADLRTRWSEGRFADSKEKRRAAMERDRMRVLAQDVLGAGQDFLDLAYPRTDAGSEGQTFDGDRDDEDVLETDADLDFFDLSLIATEDSAW